MENCVLGLKSSKEGLFFAVFKVCTKTLWNFVVCMRWCSNSLKSRPMGYTRCCDKIKGNYKAESFVLSKKKHWKRVFWGFQVCFAFSPNKSDDAENHEIDAQLSAQCVATMKKAFFSNKNCLLYQKTSKNGFVLGFIVCTKTFRKFLVCLRCRWQSNQQDNCPLKRLSVTTLKKGKIIGEQITFHAKNLQKSGFWGFQTLHR